MPIEITELKITINIEEDSKPQSSNTQMTFNTREVKADIIRICTRNVLKILKEKQER